MLRTQFEASLRNLHDQFHEMGAAVSDAVDKSVYSFVKHDVELAKEVIANDVNINEYELKLETKGLEMIALQQPVTSDLRLIFTIMKAVNDLERIGDHAVSISKATIRTKSKTRIPEVEKRISEMAAAVQFLIKDALDAFVNEDTEAAVEIANRDEEINNQFTDIYDICIHAMKEDSETIVVGTEYLKVSRFLERMGDYTTNICEWIIYLKTGKITELHTANDE